MHWRSVDCYIRRYRRTSAQSRSITRSFVTTAVHILDGEHRHYYAYSPSWFSTSQIPRISYSFEIPKIAFPLYYVFRYIRPSREAHSWAVFWIRERGLVGT